MVTIVLAYASRDGQTRRVAERMAATLRGRGCTVDVRDVMAGVPADFDLARYDAAVVAASIRMGKHPPPMIRFVREQRAALAAMPNVFLSVSLTAHAIVDPNATEGRRRRASAEIEKTIAHFVRDTGWTPNAVHSLAGALLYRQYGFFLRLLMRFISGVVGASTDTSRDHEYTDWTAVERYANAFADRCEAKDGAGSRNRTHDQRFTKPLLYP